MTNKEWLDYLAHNAPDELAAWFDAEHVETEERALDGDTEPENADSRERLDADVRKWCGEYAYQADMVWTWLNRQVAITSNAMRGKIAELTAERVKLRSQICKLEDDLVRTSDERDNWKANCEDWKKHARAAENACYETMLEREAYREKFGKCLDYADAIHALMDDEGMA